MLLESWNVEMLGRLSVRCGDQETDRFPTRKVAALLAYLAYYPGISHTREELVDRFWPDLGLDAARHNLRQTLFSLRRCLESPDGAPPALTADRTSIRLDAARITTDVVRFEHTLQETSGAATPAKRKQALQAAIDLYRGELLPGHYEEWIGIERIRLADVYVRALQQLLTVSDQVGDLDTAIDAARRIVAANHLDESTHCALIRLYIAANRPIDARRQFDSLADTLRAEFDTAPSPEAQTLIARLQPPSGDIRPRLLPVARSENQAILASVNISAPALPMALDRFFGRDAEIATLLQHLEIPLSFNSRRLLTLTGPGGSGKTRLAMEVAHSLAQGSGHAVYFAVLADLTDVRAVPMRLAAALGLTPTEKVDPMNQITSVLGRTPSCLVLDNFEHLVPEGVSLVATLLQQVSSLRCLVTSRRRLGLPGEHVFQVPPLPTPQRDVSAGQLLSFASVALYVDRVRMIRPAFALTPENARAVATLCDRLEGIPLAIELAAARSVVLSPAQLLAQLEDRFRILAAQRRPGAITHHRSLRAALDLSYDQLSSAAQRLFLQLAVFHGGWTLEAAEAITGKIKEASSLPPAASEALISGLEELRECSLISTVETSDGLRFRMLETLREYGLARCPPAELKGLASRHADYYLHLAEGAASLYPGPNATAALDALEADHDNLRAALAWSKQRKAPVVAQRLAGALWRFWLMRGHYQEGRDWLEAALDRQEEDGTADGVVYRARGLCGAGILALAQGDIAGQGLLDSSLNLYRSLGDLHHVATLLLRLGRLAISQDDVIRANTMLQEGLAIARELQDRHLIADALYQLSYEARERGDPLAAWSLLQECLTYARQIGNKEFLGDVVNWLGTVALLQNDAVSARHYHEQALTLYRESSYQKGLGWALLGLGNVERADGKPAVAQTVFAESLRCFHELNDRVGMFHALLRCAYVEAEQERYLRAAHLLSAAEALRSETGFLVQPSERPDRERCLAATQTALDFRRFALAWADAIHWSLDQMIRFALSP